MANFNPLVWVAGTIFYNATGKSQIDADIEIIVDIISDGPISRLRRAPKIIRMCTKGKKRKNVDDGLTGPFGIPY